MAFLDRVPDTGHLRNQRFSLLLLSHSDVYFHDHSAEMIILDDDRSEKKRLEGRLKVCASCVCFDPKEYSQPIYKFPHSAIIGYKTEVCDGERRFSLAAKSFSEMKDGNLVKPWTVRRPVEPAKFAFVIKFSDSDQVLDQLLELHDAWLDKTYGERQEILSAITARHQESIQFNIGWIEDLSEQILFEVVGSRVLPLTHNPGRILLTTAIIYFQPFNNIDSEPVFKFKLNQVKAVEKRRYLLQDVGIEIFFNNGNALYFAFDESDQRDEFMRFLIRQEAVTLESKDQKNMMLAWQQGAISNFDYLMYLNNFADRSFTDLTQYPVFPWIIKDYTSDAIDLTDPATFRDLSKPMGAQNQERLDDFIKRYEEMPEPKFFYGTHYSTPGYVLFYTLRVAPEYSLNLQNGKFDRADRLFRSISNTWLNAYNGVADVKELIPEFFMDEPNFLHNMHNLDLGVTQAGEKVEDVGLPPWAVDASDFLKKNREALECDFVSQRIHHWIDLIFGYKQTGPEAVKAHNVFYYLTYESEIDLDAVVDPAEKNALKTQIMEFGQTPRQLFHIPHPQKSGPTLLPELKVIVDAPDSGDADHALSQSSASYQEEHAHHHHHRGINSRHASMSDGDSSSVADMKDDKSNPSGYGDEESSKKVTSVTHDIAATELAKHMAELSMEALSAPSWAALSSLTHKFTLPLHKDVVTSVAVSPDGCTLFSVSQDSTLTVYDLSTYQHLLSQRIGTGALSSVVLLPDEESLLVSSWDNSLYIFSIESGGIVTEWNAHHDAIAAVQISTLGSDVIAISGAWDGVIKMWRLQPEGNTWRHECLVESFEHTEEITALATHEGTNMAASGDSSGRIMVWDLTAQRLLKKLPDAHTEPVNDIAFTPDGAHIVTGSADMTMKLIKLDSLVEVVVFEVPDEITQILTDGTYILSGSVSGTLSLWDAANETEVSTYTMHKDPVSAICVDKRAKMVISGDEGHNIIYWTVES